MSFCYMGDSKSIYQRAKKKETEAEVLQQQDVNYSEILEFDIYG